MFKAGKTHTHTHTHTKNLLLAGRALLISLARVTNHKEKKLKFKNVCKLTVRISMTLLRTATLSSKLGNSNMLFSNHSVILFV